MIPSTEYRSALSRLVRIMREQVSEGFYVSQGYPLLTSMPGMTDAVEHAENLLLRNEQSKQASLLSLFIEDEQVSVAIMNLLVADENDLADVHVTMREKFKYLFKVKELLEICE